MTALTDVTPAASTTRQRSRWGRFLFAFLLTVASGLVLAGAFLFGLTRLTEGRAMPGVQVGGVSIAGLDRADAEARLREALPPVSSAALRLSAGSETTTVRYSEIGRDYDVATAVDRALAVGRTGSLGEQLADGVRALAGGISVPVEVHFDRARLQAAIDRAAAAAERPAVDATIVLAKDRRSFTTTPSAPGVRVDRARAEVAASEAMAAAGTADASVGLETVPVEPTFTTEQAEAAVAEATKLGAAIGASDLRLTHGDSRFVLSASRLQRWVTFKSDGASFAPALDRRQLQKGVAGFAAKIDQDARNATFKFGKQYSIKVVPGQVGQKLDVRATADRVEAALLGRAGGTASDEVAMVVKSTTPRYSTEKATAAARKVEKLGPGWTTYYPVSEKNFWGNNITRPTAKIDGTVVDPGEWFDFWEVVGSLRELGGIGPGGAIIGGRTEPTGAFGGGICSCSTTIWNAAMRAGLENGKRKAHYYYISRYPLGLDATVARGDNYVTTMSFRNDTGHPILVRGINARGVVRFEIYGVPDGRRVTFTRPIVWNYQEAGDSVEYTDKLAPGARERVESPIDGRNTSVTRIVRDRNGKVIHRDVIISYYARITGVTEIGRRPGDPPAGTVIPIP